jgi:hypothetical protein
MTARLLRRFRRLLVLLRQAGPAYVVHVAYVSWVLPPIMEALSAYAPLHAKVVKLWQYARVAGDLRDYRRRRDEVLAAGRPGYQLSLEDFGLSAESTRAVRASLQAQSEVVLADIDQDGYLLSRWGSIEGARTVPEREYLARRRFALQVITDGRIVAVRKHYGTDRLSFVTELKALHRLGAAGCRVPALVDVDFDARTLAFSYVKGRELRLELAAQGATLLDRVILQAPGYAALSPGERRLQQITEGRPHLGAVIDAEYAGKVFENLQAMHRAGIVWKDIKYGNMLIAAGSGEPYLIDFDTAYDCSRTGKLLFRLLCDRNIEDFNQCFGTEKLTWRRIKDQLKSEEGKRTGYSPAYFGYGLRTGALLKNYVGYGRWHFTMAKHLPPLAGARILDIGANDAFHSLQSLRHGAREAIAIERNDDAIARGLWFRDVFEWADNRAYDFRYVQTDMARIPETDLGRFDFAMALCSIYYLDDAGMAALIAHVSTVTDTLLLMCNTEEDIGRTDAREYTKASVPYTVEALSANGFPYTTVFAPSNYSRPLVIGRTRRAAGAAT